LLDAYEALCPSDPYHHWDDLERLTAPAGVSHEVWWAALKLARSPRMCVLPLCDRTGRPFRYCVPDSLQSQAHRLDRDRAASVVDADTFRQLAARALDHEAMASARLAGADLPADQARELLRTGRPSRDHDERKVGNLGRALQEAGGWRDRDLRPEMVLDLHRMIMDGLPAQPDSVGRLRRDDETPAVGGAGRSEPPPAGELDRRLESMCAFANDKVPGAFIHPLIRAAILHFWLAYDRPFVDGNGRAARALFHWIMLRQGYDGFALLPVSAVLAQAPDRYALAFRQTEADDNDLTYFILHQAGAVRAADRELQLEMQRSAKQREQAARNVRTFAELNPRQQALVAHALRRPEVEYVIAGHQHSHGVTHQTARDDLFDLVRRGLLSVSREGRTYRFHSTGMRPH